MPAEQKFISSTLTWTGIQIRKYVGKKWPSYPKSAPALTKIIEYPETSRMAQMGIDKVFIENAGKYGKRFSYYSGSDCLFSGLSKGPGSEAFKDQLRHYFKMKKQLIADQPFKKTKFKDGDVISFTKTSTGTEITKSLSQREGVNSCHIGISYTRDPELNPSALMGLSKSAPCKRFASLNYGTFNICHVAGGHPVAGTIGHSESRYNFVDNLREYVKFNRNHPYDWKNYSRNWT